MKEILERLEQKMDAGFARTNLRLDGLDAELRKQSTELQNHSAELRNHSGELRKQSTELQNHNAELRKQSTELQKQSAELQNQGGGLQRLGVLLEAVSADVKMALEGVVGNREVMDRQFVEVLTKLDERAQPLELAMRHLATRKPPPR